MNKEIRWGKRAGAMAGIALLAGVCVAGTRARGDAREYRTSGRYSDGSLGGAMGAELVPAVQVRNIFRGDMRGYVVVEAAMFPDPGARTDAVLSDFVLLCGGGEYIRAASPRAIVGEKRREGKGRDLAIYPSVGVGVAAESGPGGRRVYKEVDVGLAAGPAVPDYPRADPAAMEWELESRGFPEGVSDRPVAGYLYFPYSPGKQKKASYELKYLGPNGRQTVLPLR